MITFYVTNRYCLNARPQASFAKTTDFLHELARAICEAFFPNYAVLILRVLTLLLSRSPNQYLRPCLLFINSLVEQMEISHLEQTKVRLRLCRRSLSVP
jgi:hypothetical protein